jgi:hypothetical protein
MNDNRTYRYRDQSTGSYYGYANECLSKRNFENSQRTPFHDTLLIHFPFSSVGQSALSREADLLEVCTVVSSYRCLYKYLVPALSLEATLDKALFGEIIYL